MQEPARPDSPVITLLTAAAMWDMRLSEALHEVSLTTRRYGLLAHVQSSPGISFSELARRSGITVQSAHTAVRTLVKDGLVQDATAHAGAASALRVTKAGVAALEVAQRVVAALDEQFRAEQPRVAEALHGRHEDAV